MNSKNIKIIAPKISEKRAEILLTEKKRFFSKRISVRKLEVVHLPHYIFTVDLSTKQGPRTVTISVDAILGSFALFDHADINYQKETPPELFEFTLTEEEAQEAALFEYRRVLLGYGLKRHDPVSVKTVVDCRRIYYPYWLGYFMKRGRYDFTAIDALSGQKQGVKMRKVFLLAFTQKTRN